MLTITNEIAIRKAEAVSSRIGIVYALLNMIEYISIQRIINASLVINSTKKNMTACCIVSAERES
jgi:hypothetical protein